MPLQPVQLVHYQSYPPWIYSAHAPLIKHQCLASQVGNPSPLSAESGVKRFAVNLNFKALHVLDKNKHLNFCLMLASKDMCLDKGYT